MIAETGIAGIRANRRQGTKWIGTADFGLLRLSPFASELETRDAGGGILSQGLYHRFTGAAFSLAPGALALLRGIGPAPLDDGDLAAGGPDFADMIVALRSAGLLVTNPDQEGLVDNFCDLVLTRPICNPAIVARDNAGGAMVIRPHKLSLCTLPRTFGRPDIVEEPLGDTAARLLHLAQEHATLRQAEATLSREGIARDRVLSALQFLCDPDRQLLRLVAPGADPDNLQASHHNLMQSFHWSHPLAIQSRVAATEFYRHRIEDPQANFDWVEPTVSHAFREPTAAFGGRSYGASLGKALSQFIVQCARKNSRLRILEIGGGLGFVAKSLIAEARRVLGSGISIDYTLMDLSDALVARQRSLLREADANIRFVVGDAQCALGPGLVYDLALANEVIADFDMSPADGGAGASPEHTGVQRFIELLSHVLAPGGKAILIEYGTIDAPPEPVWHLNHVEHAVDFRAVARHARHRGFRVELSPLADVLQIDDRVEMLVGQQEAMLCWNALLAKHGRSVDYRAYDRSEFLRRYGDIVTERQVLGPPFAAMRAGLHFGPSLAQFSVLDITLAAPI